jgi:hypothetical protein
MEQRTYSVDTEFSPGLIRTAVISAYIETFRNWLLLLLVIWGGVALSFFVIPSSIWYMTPVNSATGVFFGLTLALAGFVALSALGVVLTRRANRQLKTSRVAYAFTAQDCKVVSDALATTFSWSSIVRFARYPTVLLLEIAEARSRSQLTESVVATVRNEGNLSVLAREGLGFPVFWVYTIPFRKFLVVPTKALTKDQADFICNAVRASGRDS